MSKKNRDIVKNRTFAESVIWKRSLRLPQLKGKEIVLEF